MRLQGDGRKGKLVLEVFELFLFARLVHAFVRRTLVRCRTRRPRHREFIQPARRAVLLNSLKGSAAWRHVFRIFVFSRSSHRSTFFPFDVATPSDRALNKFLTFNHPMIHSISTSDRKSTRLNSSHSQISYAVF